MSREYREARKIIRMEKSKGYDGPFVILRETMMEEMQMVYGRVMAENKRYQQAIDHLLDGKPICDLCEDQQECTNHDRWLEGKCPDFLLRFPDAEEAAEAFNEAYGQCAKKCGGPCDGCDS